MPVGDPILSLENNLDNIFGFVYGEITAPNENILQVPFIQYRDPYNNTVSCPRGKFKRLIFSQEIKYALKYGYSIDIEYCYKFKRGKDLFTEYVKDHYEIKKNSKNQVQKSISKLFLNALYGRLGMKELESTLRIVDKKEGDDLYRNTNVTVFSELTDNKYLIKYNGKITDNIKKLYSKDSLTLEKNKTISYSKEQLKNSGINKNFTVPSAVHIAAAIASYARILINEYKNIPGNPCVYSDTDSAVLTRPLHNNLVGVRLGQMKLEQKILKGIFIRNKLYCIINSKGQEIIKSSGIDSSRLNYELFIKLLNGGSIEIERTTFNVGWKDLSLKVVSSNLFIHGIPRVKTIYNTPDVNFKFISIYNPLKYSLIVHPLFTIIHAVKVHQKNKIKNTRVLGLISEFSYLELFTYFIFILSYLAIIIIFLYHIY